MEHGILNLEALAVESFGTEWAGEESIEALAPTEPITGCSCH